MPFAFGFVGKKLETGGFVAFADRGEFRGEDTREDESALWGEAIEDAIAFGDEQRGHQIRADDVILFARGEGKFREVFAGNGDFVFDAIGAAVFHRDADSDGIEVEGGDRRVAELCGGNGEDAGAAADIEHGTRTEFFSFCGSELLDDLCEAEMCGGVLTGAEAEAGIEGDD